MASVVSWYEHRGVTLTLGWSSVTVAVATYRPQRVLGWGEQKAREPPSGSCLPHRAPGRIYPDQGSDRQRSEVSGRPRAACPQHSLCTSQDSGDKGWRKDPQASMGICSTPADTVGDPVPGKSDVLATEEGVWGWLLSLFMARKDLEFWDVSPCKDRDKMSDVEPLNPRETCPAFGL